MSVMTVLGQLKGDIGIALPHEHLLLDLRNQYSEPSDPEEVRVGLEKVEMSKLGLLRRNPYALKDNLLLDDVNIAVKELEFFRAAGGQTVVDCTSVGIKRDITKLKEIAERTKLNVIAGCGYYTHDTHPAEMPQKTIEEIALKMVNDLTVGIDGTDICAGVIGEIGTSNPIDPMEKKNLKASALAQKETNAPIQIHTHMWGSTGLQAIDILTQNGVNAERIVICHTDVSLNLDYMQELLRKGVYIQFDNFGKEFYIKKADRKFAGGSFATDIERVRTIKYLIDKGHIDKILATNDICIKTMLRTYGGWGYDHILTNIVPMMQDEEISDADIDKILRTNPAKWLTGTA